MYALPKSNFSSRSLAAGVSALALISFSKDGLTQVGQSAFNRGVAYQTQLLGNGSVPQFRTHLVGEVVTRPTIVQAPVGTTVVAGSTAINARTIAARPGTTATQLDIRCPIGGGRVLMFGNRIYNNGQIVSGAESTQVVTHCDRSLIGSVMSVDNQIINNGRIQAIK